MRCFAIALSLAVVAASTFATEPRNIDEVKRELRAYHDSGEYERDIARVAGEARRWVERRIAARRAGEHLALVFDLDETLVANWATIRASDFGYLEEKWLAWVDSAEAPAIAPVVDLLRFAREHDLAIFVITARPESQRAATEKNLRRIGYAGGVTLICAPNDDRRTAAKFKTAQRQKLVSDGFVIVANIGDQESDLAGGSAERTFKLPNPFYFTP